MKTVANVIDNKFRQKLATALTEAISGAVEEVLNNSELTEAGTLCAVEKHLQELLDADEMRCWLSFYADGPEVLVGLGPGDVAAKFIVELADGYRDIGIRSEEQKEEVVEMIAAMQAFIETLKAEIAVLEAQIDKYLR